MASLFDKRSQLIHSVLKMLIQHHFIKNLEEMFSLGVR